MVRQQWEKIQNMRKGDKRIEGKSGGGSVALADEGQIGQWRYTSWMSSRRKSKCYLQKKQGRSWGEAPGVRAAKCSEFREVD